MANKRSNLSKCISFTYEELDSRQFEAGIPQHQKQELNKQESVSGFVACDPQNPDQLYIAGGQIALYCEYVKEEHKYSPSRLKKKQKEILLKNAKGMGLASERDIPKDKKADMEAQAKEAAMAEMRSQGITDIKENRVPIYVSKSQQDKVVFIGMSSDNELLGEITKRLHGLGFSKLTIEGALIDNQKAAPIFTSMYNAILFDHELLETCKVNDPRNAAQQVGVLLGGVCEILDRNADKDAEGAKFKNFDLDNRDEIISLLKDNKEAILCQFKFPLNGVVYKFIHNKQGVYASIAKEAVGKDSAETDNAKVPQSEKVMEMTYVYRTMRALLNEMVKVV